MAPSVHVQRVSCIENAFNTTYIMSSQLHNRGGMTSRNSRSVNRNPVFINRVFEGTSMRLLAAPTVDDKAMWKSQAFNFARDKLRGKLSKKISADNVIAIMGEHFPVSTMTAEQEARRIVRKYREAFLNVENLSPSSFLDVEGVDVTGIMYRNPRPENVCHLGVDACIPMRKLSEGFGTSLSEFTVSYFLPLPQSFAPSRADFSKLASASNVLPTVANTMDSFLFSPSSKKARREGKPPPSQKSTFQLEMELAGKA